MSVPDALTIAHSFLRKAVPGTRKEAHVREGVLAQTFREAMRIWDAQKAEGVPIQERLTGLSATLRAAWPQTREWKYLCTCHDDGLQIEHCPGDATCGRTRAHLPHEFGTPCWCQAGQRFRARPKPSAEDFTAAGKSKPTRVGR